ncbi:MAG: hypothetical protein CL398_08770 [Acidiferrobacteraceae bacterium]|nr:hypothetical protein [Acidiferrobacteraceae bacterium]
MPVINNGSIDVWTISIDSVQHLVSDCKELLSPEERMRADRLVVPYAGKQFYLSRGVLRIILNKYLNITEQSIQFAYGAHGKPQLAKCHNSKIEFNASKSGKYLIYGVTNSMPIGVDIEEIRESKPNYYLRIAKRFFSAHEFSSMLYTKDHNSTDLFFTCWSRKEAYLKRHGIGLSRHLASFVVNVSPSESARLIATPWLPSDVQETQLIDLPAPNAYRTALAVASSSNITIRNYTEL